MKTQSIFLTVLALSISLFSCQQKNSKTENDATDKEAVSAQRFSTQLDTFYKNNSLEVDWVNRTFYKMGGMSSKNELSIMKIVGTDRNYYSMRFVERNEDQSFNSAFVPFENDSLLKKAFESMRTVANNPDKTLNFNFGDYDKASITYDPVIKGISLYCPDNKESVMISIDKSEIDSMQSCYNRFISETK